MEFSLERSYADEMDRADALASFRDQFAFPNESLIYLDGNSLGRMPIQVADRLENVLQKEWAEDLINSWNKNWWEAPVRVGEKIAGLIGSAPGQVIACDSVSVNLFKLVMAALSLMPDRKKAISDTLNFPTDLYVLQGCLKLHNTPFQLELIQSSDGDITPDLDELFKKIDDDTALVTLSQVTFKSGYLYEMREITEKAHRHGALVIWDLCHSVGVIPIDLDACDVDFALGCTYKYLNGGPGSPAFIYVNKRWQEKVVSPIWGWWGQASPFNFDLTYQPASGMKKFLTGSQPILSLLCLESALEPLLQAGVPAIRKKSIILTDYFIYLFDRKLSQLGYTLGSPRESALRGSQVSLRHPEGYRINRVMIEKMDLIPDFRDPDNIRFGFAPIYTSFRETWEAVERASQVVCEKLFEIISKDRLTVT